jgi:phosphinothricin acetyltransferase
MTVQVASPTFRVRPARPEDAAAVAEIYSQGIEDRIATFETEPRSAADITPWFDSAYAFVAVIDASDQVVGYAVAHPYADRCCYRGIGEFSVYVRRSCRGQGVGGAAMAGLIQQARENGLWKLLSRVFPENRASLALMRSAGFREVGVHERHGKLQGVWMDTVIVELLITENLD